jgi:hypothetical protein
MLQGEPRGTGSLGRSRGRTVSSVEARDSGAGEPGEAAAQAEQRGAQERRRENTQSHSPAYNTINNQIRDQ